MSTTKRKAPIKRKRTPRTPRPVVKHEKTLEELAFEELGWDTRITRYVSGREINKWRNTKGFSPQSGVEHKIGTEIVREIGAFSDTTVTNFSTLRIVEVRPAPETA